MKTLIFKVLYLLKMCPIFVSSVHNYLVKKYWIPIDALVVWCPTWSKNLGQSLVSGLMVKKVVNQSQKFLDWHKNSIQRHLLDPTHNISLIMLLWRSGCISNNQSWQQQPLVGWWTIQAVNPMSPVHTRRPTLMGRLGVSPNGQR